MRAEVFLRHLMRESRGGLARLLFFILCLAVGVGTVVAVAGMSSALDRAVRGEAKQLLAADLAIEGRQALSPELVATVGELPGSQQARVLEMLTLVARTENTGAPEETPEVAADEPGQGSPRSAGSSSLLAELKAVGEGYPFYGELRTEPALPLAQLLGPDGTMVAPEVLTRLGLEVGDSLRIGGQSFTIRATLRAEPDRIGGAFSMGPRVFLDLAGLERAGLDQFGSTITYRTLVRLPPMQPEQLSELADGLREALPADGRYRLQTFREAQPGLRQGMDRVDRFLGLAALLSLLIGGVGVAQTVRAWIAGRQQSIAVLKCLGYTPRQVLALFLTQTAFLALAGSVVGAALGIGLQALVARLLADVLPVSGLTLQLWQPAALLRGLVLGLGIALLFSLPPLLAARRVPPVKVLRQGAEPLPTGRWGRLATRGALLLGIFIVASAQARSLTLGSVFTAALLALVLLLSLAAWLLTRLARRPTRRAGPELRYGLAALGRPGAATLSAVVALGLGFLVVTGMHLVGRGLTQQLDRDLPAQAPSAFLIDIQPHQWSGLEQFLQSSGAEGIDSVPVVTARLAAIDDRPIEQLLEEAQDGDQRWSLGREQRLTYLEALPEDNRIVAGSLWSDPQRAEASVEQEFARNMGLELGSTLSFDIQGVQVELVVTSLREVDWQSFGINFFLVVEPGVLDKAPQLRVAAARLPVGQEDAIQDQLAQSFPNVSLIRIREVLEKVSLILNRLARGVRLLGLLTVLAGLAILAGAVAASAVRRGAEVALLKTLGMSRGQVAITLAVEQGLVGLAAGLIGVSGGLLLAMVVLERGMEIHFQPEPWRPLVALFAAISLSALAGLGASWGALRKKPIAVLRRVEG